MSRRKNKGGMKSPEQSKEKNRGEEAPPNSPISESEPENTYQKESALEYVNMIRQEFSATPEVYTDFTQILKDFDAWKISTDEFITKVCGLFSGKPNLVAGLNRFLPAGFQIARCENGTFKCTMMPAFKKNEKRLRSKLGASGTAAGSSSSSRSLEIDDVSEEYESEEDEDEELDFIYDVGYAQDLYKNYCKERRSRNVEEVIAKGKEIREIAVPLLQWLEPDYFTDTQKGLIFTKMLRSIKKILMLEQRFKMFSELIAPTVGVHAELVKTEFLNHHCLAYHRLVEGYMQTNDLFPEDTPLAPEPSSSNN